MAYPKAKNTLMNNSTNDEAPDRSGLSRRTALHGAAWAAPAIVLSAASPAAAVSTPALGPLTAEFTQPIYSTSAGGSYGAPVVQLTVRDSRGPVPNATVGFTITDAASGGGPDALVPTAGFDRIGGPVQATALTDISGRATPSTVHVGLGIGTLRVVATVSVTTGGTLRTATAAAVLSVQASSTSALYAVGYGGDGAQGTGSTKNSSRPTAVALSGSAARVALVGSAAYRAAFALDESGTVWGWGSDYYHLQGSRGNKNTPYPISGLPRGIVQLRGNYYAMFALTASGEVWGWGYNLEGQFADGTKDGSYRHTPVRIPNLGPVKKLSGNHYNVHALLKDGTVWNWGYGDYGSLGNGKPGVNRHLTPTKVSGLPAGRKAVDIAGRYGGTYVVLDDGAVWAWGSSNEGQIGDGAKTARSVPTRVAGVTTAVRVYAQYYNAGVVLADGTCRVWGKGAYYNLGNGSTADSPTPIDPGLRNVAALSWGCETGHALLTDGTVYGWGYNGNSETGTGLAGSVRTPTRIEGIGPVRQLEQSQYSTYLLTV